MAWLQRRANPRAARCRRTSKAPIETPSASAQSARSRPSSRRRLRASAWRRWELSERRGDPFAHPAEPLRGDHVRLRARRPVGDVAEELREVRNHLFAVHAPEALQGRPPRDGRQPVKEPDSSPLEAAKPLHGPQPGLGEDVLRVGRPHPGPDDGVEEEPACPVVEDPGTLAVAAANSFEEPGVIVFHPFRRLYDGAGHSLTAPAGPRTV